MIPVKVRNLVLARAEGKCERCGVALDPFFYSLQHRRARGMGGSKRPDTNSPTNLVALHGSATTGCHGFIEAHPDVARAEGMRISQVQSPALVAVLTWRGWVWLNHEGGFVVNAA